MSNISIGIPMENRHISSSLMEKILSVKNNSLVSQFFAVYKVEANGKGIKNVTVNGKGEMTFLPKGRECVIDTTVFPNIWKKDSRQSGTYGKVLRKLLVENGVDPKSIIAKELEDIVNSLKARYTVEGSFEIVSGNDISYYYLHDNYDDEFNCGTMEGSCMRYGGSCQDATEFYANNENCEMVVLKHPEAKLGRARALLWKDTDGNKWMDRIYANDAITEAFKIFAHSNGWPHKESQDCCAATWVFPDGRREKQNIYIDMDTDYWPRPYMDTMCYIGSYKITNDTTSGYDYCQSEPDDDDGNVYDDIDDRYIPEDSSCYVDNRDLRTHVDNAFYCDITNEWYLHDDGVSLHDGTRVWEGCTDIIFVESKDEYYHKDDAAYCQYNDEWYAEDEVEWVDDLGMYIVSSSINNAYEDKGWIQDEDDNWVDPQYSLI